MGCLGASALLRLKNLALDFDIAAAVVVIRGQGGLQRANCRNAICSGNGRRRLSPAATASAPANITGATSPGPHRRDQPLAEFAQGDLAAVRLAPVVCALARSRLGW